MAGVGKYFQTTSLRANCSINHWPLKPVSPGHRENGAGRRQVPGTRWPVLGGLCRLERTGHRTPRTLWGTTEVCILDVCSAKDTLQLLSRPQARPSLICTALNVTHAPATSARPQTQESPRPMASPLGEHQGAPLHKQGGCSLHLHLLAPATPPHSSLCTTWDSLGAPPPSQLVICVHQPCPLNSTPAPCADVVQVYRRQRSVWTTDAVWVFGIEPEGCSQPPAAPAHCGSQGPLALGKDRGVHIRVRGALPLCPGEGLSCPRRPPPKHRRTLPVRGSPVSEHLSLCKLPSFPAWGATQGR